MWPRWTVTPVGGTSQILIVLFSLAHDRLGQVAADLLGVDVERGDELDVADVVVAELDVHQARDPRRRVGVLVVLNALDQRARAVADADDGYANRTHADCSFFISMPGRPLASLSRFSVRPCCAALASRSARSATGPRARPIPARAAAARACSCRRAPGAGQRGAYALEPFLEAAAPAFEDPQPHIGAWCARRRRSGRRNPRPPRTAGRPASSRSWSRSLPSAVSL